MAVDAMGTVLPLINGPRAFFEPNFELILSLQGVVLIGAYGA